MKNLSFWDDMKKILCLSYWEVFNRWSESQCIKDPLVYPELMNILIIYSKKSYEDSESLNCGLAFIILSHYLCA